VGRNSIGILFGYDSGVYLILFQLDKKFYSSQKIFGILQA
jgi:hypothetical protein